MFKKNQKENGRFVNSESSDLKENTNKNSEFSLSTLIGVQNLRKWNTIKLALGFKTNQEFTVKLLDLAEKYLDGLPKKNEPYEIKKSKKNKNKNKSSAPNPNNDINEGATKVTETNINYNVDSIHESTRTKVDAIKSSKKCETSIKKKIEKVQLPLKDLKNCENKNAEEATEKENKPTNNLDKIRITLCQLCNTHHIEDHCPINVPHYILTDSLDRNQWEEKFKLLHEMQLKKETIDEDIFKYSFSVLSLPISLCLKDTNVSHGLGVFAKTDIEPFTELGPLIGKIVKEMEISEDVNMKNIWEIQETSENIYFDTESCTDSNWLKYLRPAPTRDNKNLTVIVKDSKLFFVSIKFVKSGEELLYWQDSATTSIKKKMEKTTCGGCNIEFSHPHYYRIHCSLFHDIRYSLTIKKYHCKVCGVAVLGKENIMKHAAEQHNGQGAYQCQFCKKFFLRLNYLEMHRTYGCSANPHRSRPLCDFCGRKFCQPQKLKVHIKRMHSDLSEVLKEFQCKSCLKILGSRAALQRHLKEVHKKQTEGNCSCSRCGKTFQNKSNLKIHMLTHSGIKPFKCTVTTCNAAFTTKQCLQFHYKKFIIILRMICQK